MTRQHDVAAALQSVARSLDRVKAELSPLCDELGGQFVPFQEITIALRDVKGLISQSRYYTDCPRCQCKPRAKCALCDGRGFIPYARRGLLSDADKTYLGIE